jgi:hypothetical protein
VEIILLGFYRYNYFTLLHTSPIYTVFKTTTEKKNPPQAWGFVNKKEKEEEKK